MTRWPILTVALMMLGAATPALADYWADCLQEADPELSIRVCTEIMNSGKETGQNLAYAYNGRGAAHASNGDYDRAIVDLDKAIQLKPDNAYAYSARGYARANKGDYDHAIADFDKAIQLKPDLGPAYYNRGVAHDSQGDLAQALSDYRAAAHLIRATDPWNGRALARIAEIEKKFVPLPTVRPLPTEPKLGSVPGVSIGAPVAASEEAPVVQGVFDVQLPRLRPSSLRDPIEPTINWK